MGRYVIDKVDSIWNQEKLWSEKYITDNNDLLAYSILFKKFERMEELVQEPVENFTRFSKKYPNHPYTQIINDRILTLNTIKIGGNYIDFTATNIDGESVKLSDYIEKKVALNQPGNLQSF